MRSSGDIRTDRGSAGPGRSGAAPRERVRDARLFRRFILLTLLCSVLPLLLVGWGINVHHTRLAKSRMIDAFETRVAHHRKIIELFLRERCSSLELIAHTHSRNTLASADYLEETLRLLNREDHAFTDLGVISAEGKHLAYVGPFDLMDKNYSETFWFKEVREKGLYISDMFLGFRQEPHFIIAVLGSDRGNGGADAHPWILRATIDTEVFRSLVENVTIGRTGEVYLVNRDGVFQTRPRISGEIMGRAPLSVGAVHEGIEVKFLEGGADAGGKELPRRVVGQAWLEGPSWLLVVQQDYSEAFAEVRHANTVTLVFLHLSAVMILIVAVLITRYMISAIRKRDAETARLNSQLLQAGKLAAIGELSAGVAHEINNPLAIILTERQLLMDMESRTKALNGPFKAQFDDSMRQIDVQIDRCKRITQNLLRFSRRTESVVEKVDLNAFLREVIDLMQREAGVEGVAFETHFDETLPAILSDPSQLQQVFLNLITNAIDAHEGTRGGTITVSSRPDRSNWGVTVVIADTGKGIAPDNLDRIFDPFFTTKAVGKGTGLGLSISYSIIERLGGRIEVRSQPGKGTEFTLSFPREPPPGLLGGPEGDR